MIFTVVFSVFLIVCVYIYNVCLLSFDGLLVFDDFSAFDRGFSGCLMVLCFSKVHQPISQEFAESPEKENAPQKDLRCKNNNKKRTTLSKPTQTTKNYGETKYLKQQTLQRNTFLRPSST